MSINEGKFRATRKGVRPNTTGDRLVNVTNGIEVKRIPWKIANELVTLHTDIRYDWHFCPKKFRLESVK